MNDTQVGYNFRMTEAQAAFGRVQLKKLPKIIKDNVTIKYQWNIKFICHLRNKIFLTQYKRLKRMKHRFHGKPSKQSMDFSVGGH